MGRRAGFTLLELLIAMAILTIIVTATFTIFKGAQVAWLKGEARTEIFQGARAVLEVMSREIRSSIVTSNDRLMFKGISSSLFFVAPSISDEQSDLREIGYWLRQKEHTLMRHIDLNPDYTFDTADADDELAFGILDLGFQYFDGEVWQDSWDSTAMGLQSKLPKAVKIVLTVSDQRGQEKRSVKTVVKLHAAR